MRLLLLIFLSSFIALAQDAKFTKDLKPYKEIKFTKYFFHIYDLSIYSSDAKRPDFKKPHLFHFEYKRNISSKDLVKNTLSEWDRLQLCKIEHAKKWGNELSKIWPDIKKGDHLIAKFDCQKTLFYQNGKELGRIEGTIFSRSFFKIWLNKDSQIKELR